MYGFRIVDKLQKMDEDIQKNQLKYHTKTSSCEQENLHLMPPIISITMKENVRILHGHTYEVIFGISGFIDERGIMIDFGDIKEIWKSEIELFLDHRYLNETLPPMNTTAENIVVWIYEKDA